jgi:hypothetical protein
MTLLSRSARQTSQDEVTDEACDHATSIATILDTSANISSSPRYVSVLA